MRVVHLSPATLEALATGDHAAARAASPVPLSDFVLTDPGCVATWRRRAEQVLLTPQDAAWVTGLLVAGASGDGGASGGEGVGEGVGEVVVGQGGFHAAPDEDGMVEIGYKVDPARRSRGHARAAVAAMLDRARRDPEVRVVRASVSPDNAASLAVLAPFGFVQVGEQWDEEDGLELVLERGV
ncbi:GNAT family protein [Nocardioides sp. SOB77]|uniref:GNAT family protein n=1 Tax=Nocardioides oceani TaxID=3058369 RepID=A0ABT8FIZ8_9ACTN|nr:GNAT family protein [Nocardioides oceani]MDN4174653.1 GNAT family protein [Nocardioides oceani]